MHTCVIRQTVLFTSYEAMPSPLPLGSPLASSLPQCQLLMTFEPKLSSVRVYTS